MIGVAMFHGYALSLIHILQDELAGTENRIGVARKNYNDALQDYNTFILQFPNSFWAGFTGYKENDAYFKASAAAQTVPSVKF